MSDNLAETFCKEHESDLEEVCEISKKTSDTGTTVEERLMNLEEETKRIQEIQRTLKLKFYGQDSRPSTVDENEKHQMDQLSIFVGNVDYSATSQSLAAHFRTCGAIDRITILTDKFTGLSKGFAYIQFADPEGVTNSLRLSGSFFLGRKIKVQAKRTNVPSATNAHPFTPVYEVKQRFRYHTRTPCIGRRTGTFYSPY